ncbi:MAG: tetratricopeptide repeat protein, partial [Candidatus Aminicenantes bacterium]|nr:tetratricopeptide repeat protein [Candidatus Aminicenantes bacterium]
MEDPEGRLLLEKEEEIPLRITQKQYETQDKHLFSFQNLIPVISGNHTLFLLLKNKTARDFTSHQREIHVPEPAGTSSLSPLLLYHGRERIGGAQSLRAFSFSGTHYLVNSENNFLPDEEMGVFCQVYNLENLAAETLQLQIVSTTEVQPIFTKSFPINETLEIQGKSLDTGPIPLSSLNPGYYSLELAILDQKGEKLLSKSENFILLAQAFPVIPWVFSKQHLPFPSSGHLYALASQYFLASNYNQARSALEQALNMQEDPNARLLLGKTLYAQQDYQGSLKTVQTLYQTTGNRETAKLIALNHVALKEWAQGVIYLEKLLESSVEIGVLNLAGECYNNLKQPEKALPVLQKSLDLNPDQPNIKQLLQQIKNVIEKKGNKPNS